MDSLDGGALSASGDAARMQLASDEDFEFNLEFRTFEFTFEQTLDVNLDDRIAFEVLVSEEASDGSFEFTVSSEVDNIDLVAFFGCWDLAAGSGLLECSDFWPARSTANEPAFLLFLRSDTLLCNEGEMGDEQIDDGREQFDEGPSLLFDEKVGKCAEPVSSIWPANDESILWSIQISSFNCVSRLISFSLTGATAAGRRLQ